MKNITIPYTVGIATIKDLGMLIIPAIKAMEDISGKELSDSETQCFTRWFSRALQDDNYNVVYVLDGDDIIGLLCYNICSLNPMLNDKLSTIYVSIFWASPTDKYKIRLWFIKLLESLSNNTEIDNVAFTIENGEISDSLIRLGCKLKYKIYTCEVS